MYAYAAPAIANSGPGNNTQKEKQISDSGLGDKFAAGLVFPQDVATMKRTEHYVQFFVNQQDNAKIKWNADEGYEAPRERKNTTVRRAPTTRTLGSITLFLPAQLNVAHKTNYGEAEIGLGVASAIAAAKGFANMKMTLESLKNTGIAAGKQIAQSGKQTLVNAAEGAGATGAKAAFAIATGETQNNRTEMKFEGVDRRTFSFSFRMLPRSSAEAETVKNIVNVFRMQSAPEVSGRDGLGRTLIAPSTFDIEYKPGEHLHQISTSVLESVNVKFGGERPQFFKDNYPVETTLDLQFRELEIITKERIDEGY